MKEIIKSQQCACKKCNRSLKIMKVSTLLLFICIFSLAAENVRPQQKELSLDLKNVTLLKAISEIEKSSDYVFLITDEAKTELGKKVSIRVKNEKISHILKMMLKGTDLNYSLVERQVTVYKSREANNTGNSKTTMESIAQQKKQITGRVVDAAGMPITGANIVEVGTTNGTVTDLDGKFTLSVADDAILRISYIGYLTQDVNTAGKTQVDVVLQEDTKALGELVVIGYGSMARKDVTSSITTVQAEKLNVGAYSDPAQLLQGKVPGLVITQSSDPNASPSITLRGASTIRSGAAQEPYYVIDGVPGMSLALVAPDDIESIDVLRDATATAIYGSKAANGVIIINTKKGRTFPFQIRVGISGRSDYMILFGLAQRCHIFKPSGSTINLCRGKYVKSQRIAADAVSRTQLQIIKHIEVFNKRLLRKTPGKRCRRKCTPSVILAKSRRTVTPDSRLKNVFAVERIVGTTVNRDHSQCREHITAISESEAVDIDFVSHCQVIVG